jgi:hypothetical protein
MQPAPSTPVRKKLYMRAPSGIRSAGGDTHSSCRRNKSTGRSRPRDPGRESKRGEKGRSATCVLYQTRLADDLRKFLAYAWWNSQRLHRTHPVKLPEFHCQRTAERNCSSPAAGPSCIPPCPVFSVCRSDGDAARAKRPSARRRPTAQKRRLAGGVDMSCEHDSPCRQFYNNRIRERDRKRSAVCRP